MIQEEMEKIQIISNFVDANNISKERQVVEFRAIVEYVELSIRDVTKVQMKLDNYNYGNHIR